MNYLAHTLRVGCVIGLVSSMGGCGGTAETDEALNDTASVTQASSVPNQTIAPNVVVSVDDYYGGRWLEVRNYSDYYRAEIRRYNRGNIVEDIWVYPHSGGHLLGDDGKGRYSVYYDATVEVFTCFTGLCYPVHGSKYKVSALGYPNVWLPN